MLLKAGVVFVSIGVCPCGGIGDLPSTNVLGWRNWQTHWV